MDSVCARKEVALIILTSFGCLLSWPASIHAEEPSQTPLRILVPLKTDFPEFVSWTGTPPNVTFSGFSVEVFKRCVGLLPFQLHYEFVPYGDGFHAPDYNGMVQQLVEKNYHGIVADFTITADRIKLVDFTQPYIPSTLMMVVPFQYGNSGRLWNFLVPFSKRLWMSVLGLFLFTGLIILIVEHENPLLFAGLDWRLRLANVFWFTSMTIFFAQKEGISTKLGRMLIVFWLLVVLILTSAYTACLASILTAQTSYPTIQRFEDLLYSNLPVGFQAGSFTEDYLQRIGFRRHRLVGLTTDQSYSNALRLGPYTRGGVAAILDEQPYLQVLLNEECQFTSAGNQIAYFGGLAFAFQKNSTLTNELSGALLTLEQDLGLQRLRDSWLGNGGQCGTKRQGAQIAFENFKSLFVFIAILYIFCALWRFAEWGMLACRKASTVSPGEEPEWREKAGIDGERCGRKFYSEEKQYRDPEIG